MSIRRKEAKDNKRKQMLMSGFIVLLMIASMFAIYASSQQNYGNTVQDTGLSFTITQDSIERYTSKIDGVKRTFFVLPSQALAVPFDSLITPTLRNSEAIIYSFTPTVDQVNAQYIDLVRYDLSQHIPIPSFQAMSEEEPGYALPIFNCMNATASLPIIEFSVAKDPSVTQEGYCIRASGNWSDFLVLRDRILFEWFDVYQR